ncbi:MAG: DUF1343 domain-containing protein [Bacteroidales bacterium]|nr:DUF1343 domain-containing protein [Bacteroidales bacterium]
MKRIWMVPALLLLLSFGTAGQNAGAGCSRSGEREDRVVLGDERTGEYYPLLKGQRIAVLSNHSGIVGDKVLSGGISERYRGGDRSLVPFGDPVTGPHLVDVLLADGMDVRAIFSPEHGFRGKADAGEHVGNSVDEETGVEILSLYARGSHLPSAENMEKFDVLLVDIQDVGLRYYTYYVTMHHLMEACAAYGKKCIILDRPNPNGMYVDGPILDMQYKSGVGYLPITTVHGMTLGELARMIKGEGWMEGADSLDLTVIPCLNYTHQTRYELIQRPSPNLKDMKSIYLYASTCYFEGTVVTAGRGTEFPFEVYGHPDYPSGGFSFTPRSIPGAKNPRYMDRLCHGVDLRGLPDEEIIAAGTDFSYLIDAYSKLDLGDAFFQGRHFELEAGQTYVREMIEAGCSADDLKKRWAPDVEAFRIQRRPYLLYDE